MVYQENNQTRRYHKRPEPFLTTHDHFYDGPQKMEAPNPDTRVVPHKTSTFAILHQGSSFHLQQRLSHTSKPPLGKTQTVELFPEPLSHTRTIPSGTYRGNGTFTVRSAREGRATMRALRGLSIARVAAIAELLLADDCARHVRQSSSDAARVHHIV